MAKQSKGKCAFCGKEYAKGGMHKHLNACKEREAKVKPAEEKNCGYFTLNIWSRYEKEYWLFIEVREDATLWDVDRFLREIWLECCGHLSAFKIGGVSYESNPDPSDDGWGVPVKSMNSKLQKVLAPGMAFDYEYDFGSTTTLALSVTDYRTGGRRKEKLILLARNNPPQFTCSVCQKQEATVVCQECMYEEPGGFLCEDCREKHECGEEMLLTVCNSPRCGVCAYEGSSKYPD